MAFPYEEFDLSEVQTYPLASRQSKTRVEDFARPVEQGASFKEWLDSLPSLLGAGDIRRVVEAMVEANARFTSSNALHACAVVAFRNGARGVSQR